MNSRPVAAKSSPGPSWSDDAYRPHFHPSSARHGYRSRLRSSAASQRRRVAAHLRNARYLSMAVLPRPSGELHPTRGGVSHRRCPAAPLDHRYHAVELRACPLSFHFAAQTRRMAQSHRGVPRSSSANAPSPGVSAPPRTTSTRRCMPEWPTGIVAQLRSSGTVRPDPSACSRGDMSTAFEERRT
jgi:hypothetical protein